MDQIQKVLVKAGRKDLAQKYYHKVSQQRSRVNQIKIDEIIDDLGGTRLSSDFVDAAGKIFPYFASTDTTFGTFWNDNHASWSDDVGAFKKAGNIFLVDFRKNVIVIKIEFFKQQI